MTEFRAASANLWWCETNHPAWQALGKDCTSKRRGPLFAKVFEEICADLYGLQECPGKMTTELMTAITEKGLPYALLWGRDTPILYRADRFEVLHDETFIYPEQVPGYEGSFNNLKTKSYSLGVFRRKGSGEIIVFGSTHLWYKSGNPEWKHYQPFSQEARVFQIRLFAARANGLLNQYGGTAVLTGDMNTYPDSTVLNVARELGFLHAHDVSQGETDDTTGLHKCSEDGFDSIIHPGGFEHSIDHILIKGDGAKDVKRFVRYSDPAVMELSDHLPVYIDFAFGN